MQRDAFVPAYKRRRLERERRPRIRIVGDVGEKAARAMQALQVMVEARPPFVREARDAA